MSVIIRLQNLPWSANALDIRTFFRGLSIPDGGVHIVGGENGDAFIAFSSDEDARQAMTLDGGKLKEIQVHLLLSSRAEMQKVIETARQTTISYIAFPATPPTLVPPPPSPQPQSQPNTASIQMQQKPEPPVITSNSLSGILAQQMYQQHQLQVLTQQQNVPLLTSTSVRHDNYNTTQKQFPQMNYIPPFNFNNDNSSDSREIDQQKTNNISDNYDKKRIDEQNKIKCSRSRSKSRERRDRRRSRSRDRGRRHRDRSRSRDRRRKRRNRSRDRSRGRDRTSSTRDRSRERVRSKDRNRSYEKDDRNKNFDNNKIIDDSKKIHEKSTVDEVKKTINVWDVAPPILNDNTPLITGFIPSFNTIPINDNKPISLFNNFYNQVKPDIITQQQCNIPPKLEASETQQLLDDHHMVNSFQPVLPIIPFTSPSNANESNRFDNKNYDKNNDSNNRCCLRLKNIGTDTHYSIIRRFFSGYHIPNDGIKLINDQYGRRRGEAVVRFLRPTIALSALKKNQSHINDNITNITLISDGEYDTEVDSYRPPRGSYNSGGNNERNNRDFNRGNRDMRDNRDYNENKGYRNDHKDYRNDRYDRNAIGSKTDRYDNHSRIDDNKIENQNICDANDEDGDDDVLFISDSNHNEEGYTSLLVEDLPQSITKEDITQLFSKFSLVHIVIPKVSRNFHAYVKLKSAEDAQLALKDPYRLGYKPVFVSVCSDEIFDKAKKEDDANNASETTNLPEVIPKIAEKKSQEKSEDITANKKRHQDIDDEHDLDDSSTVPTIEKKQLDELSADDNSQNDNNNKEDHHDKTKDKEIDNKSDSNESEHSTYREHKNSSNSARNQSSSHFSDRKGSQFQRSSEEYRSNSFDRERESNRSHSPINRNQINALGSSEKSFNSNQQQSQTPAIPSLISLNFDNMIPGDRPSLMSSAVSFHGLPNINAADPRIRRSAFSPNNSGQGGHNQNNMPFNQSSNAFNRLTQSFNESSNMFNQQPNQFNMQNSPFNQPQNQYNQQQNQFNQQQMQFNHFNSGNNMRNDSRNNRNMNDNMMQNNAMETNCIFMGNLQYKTTDKDIIEWFSDIGLIPTRVHLLLNGRGLPSGDGFCEFQTPQDAKRSLIKNRCRLASRQIHLNLIPRQRVLDLLQSFRSHMDSDYDALRNHEDRNKTTSFENVKNLDDDVNDDDDDDDIKDNQQDSDLHSNEKQSENLDEDDNDDGDNNEDDDNKVIDEQPRLFGSGSSGSHRNPFKRTIDIPSMDEDVPKKQKSGGRNNPFRQNVNVPAVSPSLASENSMDASSKADSISISNRGNNTMHPAIRDTMDGRMNSQSNMMRPGGSTSSGLNRYQRGSANRNYGNDNYESSQGDQSNNRNLEGRIVGMRNVPYKANINDILKFFCNFDVPPNNVIRRYNDDGTPTGDARVCFESPMQARAAVEQNYNNRIMNRVVQLNIV